MKSFKFSLLLGIASMFLTACVGIQPRVESGAVVVSSNTVNIAPKVDDLDIVFSSGAVTSNVVVSSGAVKVGTIENSTITIAPKIIIGRKKPVVNRKTETIVTVSSTGVTTTRTLSVVEGRSGSRTWFLFGLLVGLLLGWYMKKLLDKHWR